MELLDNIYDSVHFPIPTYPSIISSVIWPKASHPPDLTIVELCYELLIQVLKEEAEEAATQAQQGLFYSPTPSPTTPIDNVDTASAPTNNSIQYNPWRLLTDEVSKSVLYSVNIICIGSYYYS